MPSADSLYPQAPAPQQSLLSGDPSKMIGTLQGIQNFQIQQAQAPALMQIPGANLQNTNIANATAQFQQEAAMTAEAQRRFANGLAGYNKPTAENVQNIASNISTSMPQIRPDIILKARDMLLNNKGGIKDAADTMRNMNRSPDAASGLTNAPPDPVTGATQRQTVASSNRMPGVRPGGLPVGFSDVASGPAGAAGISNMASMANDAPNQRALLENLNSLGNEAVSGPSSDFEKRANALAQRLFPGKGITLSTQQLANSEEYGKISEQLAGQQATAAHSTNAFLTNAYNTNPSLYLSKVGRQGITHMLQGNLDSVVAKNDAWNAYANGETDGQMHSPAEFTTWNRQFNANFNPRAFQYARMTPEERSNFRSTIPANQQQKFFNQIQDYQSKGWIDINPVPQSEQGKMPGMSGR